MSVQGGRDVAIRKDNQLLRPGPNDPGGEPNVIGAGSFTVNYHSSDYLKSEKYVNPVFRRIVE